MKNAILTAALTGAALLSACGSDDRDSRGPSGEVSAGEAGWAVGVEPPRIPGQPSYAVIIKAGDQKPLKGAEAARVYGDRSRHDTRPFEIIGIKSRAKGTIDLACGANKVKNDVKDVDGRTPRMVVDMVVGMNRSGMCFPVNPPIRTMTYGEARAMALKAIATEPAPVRAGVPGGSQDGNPST